MTHFRTPLVAAALFAMCACGGGGGSAPLPSTGGGQQTQSTAPANMVITIPPLSQQNKHFRPNYISAGTQSMTVGLVSGGSTTPLATVNLTTGSSNCTTPSGGGLQCTVTVNAPYGTDTFAVSTFPQTNGAGTALSVGEVQVTITRGATTPTVTLDLDGVPVAVALVLGQSELPVGNAGSTAVIVQAADASGNLIIGPGLFSTPIGLAVTGDTYHTLSLSGSSVTSPGQVVTLDYNGGTNVGSTITPSGSGMTGSPVTFNATGGVLNLFQYYDATNGVTLETYDVGALANGTAAIVSEVYDDAADSDFEGIAIASPTTINTIYVGGTSDFYNPASSPQTIPGVTYIPNMSTEINHEEFDAYDDIAGANGFVYYSGSTDSPEDAPSCLEDELQTGTIGKMNATTGATTEYVLKGYPGPIKVDGSGNAWFIEGSGYCGESQLISGSTWAIGELTASGTVKETSFSTAGLSGIGYPGDMAINGAGTAMFIADSDNSTATKIATATLSSPTAITLNNSGDPQAIAAATDGTTAWFGNDEIVDHYYYGYVPGSKTFSTSNLAEGAFPIESYYSYTMAYADGSFWTAGPDDEASGIGRLSGLSSSAPVAGYYPPPNSGDEEEVEMYSIAAGGGYVWVTDPCQGVVYALIYGAPSSGNITYASHRVGTIAYRTAEQMHRMVGHHAIDPHPRRPVQVDPVERKLLSGRP